MRRQLHIFCIAILFVLNSVAALSRSTTAQQDIRGGASELLNTPPRNPKVHRKLSRGKTQMSVQSDLSTSRENDDGKTQIQNKDRVSDQVEDALALGNSARDAQPPRFADAERAYRLGVKLNPKDPRPYLGLANIFYDQKQYDASAKMYRQAIQLMTSTARITVRRVRRRTADPAPSQRGEWRTYLAKALLQQGQFSKAESELRTAVGETPKNPESHALLGYSLFQQKKYSAASKALKRAAELDPDNKEYKRLLEASHTEPMPNVIFQRPERVRKP